MVLPCVTVTALGRADTAPGQTSDGMSIMPIEVTRMTVTRAGSPKVGPRPVPVAASSSTERAVLDQLERVLGSETFQQADRLKRFLTFIVKEAVAGRGGELKEYVIGVQVFRKEDTFDPRTDPIVRVQARRLRAKLMRYYSEEGRFDLLTIELPKGGYAPVFQRSGGRAAARSARSAPRWSAATRSWCCRF